MPAYTNAGGGVSRDSTSGFGNFSATGTPVIGSRGMVQAGGATRAGSGSLNGLGGLGSENKTQGSPCEYYEKGKKVAGYWDRQGNTLVCVPQEKDASMNFFNLGGAGIPGVGGAGVPAANRPNAPTLTPPREIGANIPELERMGQGYEQHLRNLESGAGYSADVLAGQTRDQTESQIAMMRQRAEQEGRTFNEDAARTELQRGAYSAQAQEKLAREQMLTGAYGQAPGIVGANEAARQGRWKTGQAGDIASMAAANQQYQTQAGMYGNELDAASSANNALLSFLGNLYGGMFNAMGNMSINQRYG